MSSKPIGPNAVRMSAADKERSMAALANMKLLKSRAELEYLEHTRECEACGKETKLPSGLAILLHCHAGFKLGQEAEAKRAVYAANRWTMAQFGVTEPG